MKRTALLQAELTKLLPNSMQPARRQTKEESVDLKRMLLTIESSAVEELRSEVVSSPAVAMRAAGSAGPADARL